MSLVETFEKEAERKNAPSRSEIIKAHKPIYALAAAFEKYFPVRERNKDERRYVRSDFVFGANKKKEKCGGDSLFIRSPVFQSRDSTFEFRWDRNKKDVNVSCNDNKFTFLGYPGGKADYLSLGGYMTTEQALTFFARWAKDNFKVEDHEKIKNILAEVQNVLDGQETSRLASLIPAPL